MDAWQDTIALSLVALAAGALLHRGWRLFFSRARGCGSCGGCASSTQGSTPNVTSLKLLPPRHSQN